MKKRQPTKAPDLTLPENSILFREDKKKSFDSEQAEFDSTRAQVQRTMLYASDADIVDMVYMLAKTCEIRAMLCTDNPRLRVWYQACESIISAAAVLLSRIPDGIKPHKSLSNDALYWPDMQEH